MLECSDIPTIEAVDVNLTETALLVERLTCRRYHDDGRGDFHPDHVRVPRSGFLVARWQEQPGACGAFRPMGRKERLWAASAKSMGLIVADHDSCWPSHDNGAKMSSF